MTGTPLGPVSTRKESCPSQQSSILVVRSSAAAAERSRPTRNPTLSRSLRTAGHSDICPSAHLTGDQVHPSGRGVSACLQRESSSSQWTGRQLAAYVRRPTAPILSSLQCSFGPCPIAIAVARRLSSRAQNQCPLPGRSPAD